MSQTNPYQPSSSISTSSANVADNLRGLLRTNQIIAMALIQGVVIITAILVFVSWDNINFANPLMVRAGGGLLLVIGVIVGLAAVLLAPIFFTVSKNRAIREYRFQLKDRSSRSHEMSTHRGVDRELFGRLGTAMLIAMALLEGSCVINAIFLVLNGSPIHLYLIAICLLEMSVFIPTMQSWNQTLESATL